MIMISFSFNSQNLKPVLFFLMMSSLVTVQIKACGQDVHNVHPDAHHVSHENIGSLETESAEEDGDEPSDDDDEPSDAAGTVMVPDCPSNKRFLDESVKWAAYAILFRELFCTRYMLQIASQWLSRSPNVSKSSITSKAHTLR